MKSLACFALLLVSSPFMAATDRAPDSALLNRWVGGQWISDGKFVDSAFSQAATVSAISQCAWSPDHIFVICDQDIKFGGTPLRDLSIYSFDPKTSKFYLYGVSLAEEKARTTALAISENGDHWVYASSDEIKGKPVQFRTVNQFHGNDEVEWWTEFSTDEGKSWTRTASGKEIRKR